jgi:hypothetical protein
MTSVGTNVVNVDTDAAGILGNDGALLERVEDAFDTIIAHGEQKAAGELWAWRASVEESGSGVDEPLLGHEVVGLDGAVHVGTVNTHGHAHQHVLRSLHRLAIDLEQIGLLERLKAEVVVAKVTVVDDGRVDFLRKKSTPCRSG